MDRLLREKQYGDEEFVEICKLRQGAALHTIDSLLTLPVGGPSTTLSFQNWSIIIHLIRCLRTDKWNAEGESQFLRCHSWITRESRVNHALTANWTAAVAASRDFHVPNWIELKDIVEIDRLTRTIGKLARKLGFFHEFS